MCSGSSSEEKHATHHMCIKNIFVMSNKMIYTAAFLTDNKKPNLVKSYFIEIALLFQP